ncbi:MAG: right-handed parallel beta-helix repeat-containing protein [Sulfuricurvum sp.]|uniref:right-handed parallel beta-helix repeat-containing protein n=1 Tax=Sulfuricurvum sp. TaxID=2025608 RepID=UPI002631407C|nr:right-handed parallel beta-helix repeat-containing protein [Sulfuricurvum sp.]MDD2828448.1 right-handed parallel beta-helix repeat-containing protein [Sulfuricurvum sp.]MDD4949453.1 right-handed parallel beta-helix repeat-containing protein [Sulfuricurvum sp.]
MVYNLLIFISLFYSLASADYTNYHLKKNDDIIEKIQTILSENNNSNIKISLERGEYQLSNINAMHHLLEFNNVKNFELDGNGSELIINSEHKGFIRITDSENIHFSNFSIDYSTLPNASGKIIAIDRKQHHIILKMDIDNTHYLEKNFHNTIEKKIYAFAFISPGIVKRGGTPVTFIRDIDFMPNGNAVLSYEEGNTSLEVTDNITIVFRYKQPLVNMQYSKKLYFKNITAYASPSGVFVGKEVTEPMFDGCNVLLKKGRNISSNGDVFHFQSSRAGIKISHATVEGVGDDIIALYSSPMKSESILSVNTLAVEPKNFIMQNGDRIDFFNEVSGEIFHSNTVSNIVKKNQQFYVQFSSNLPPDIDLKALKLYDRNCNSEGFSIENSIFKNSVRYGCFLLRSSGGLIKNNLFTNLGGAAISIKNIFKAQEGLNSENITIAENNMSNCGYGFVKSFPLIEIRFSKKSGVSGSDTQKSIRIIHNKMENEKLFSIQNVANFYLEQ